ncbi:bifunctional tetrahydrofolate synthase/dihydrofolate synthase [Mycetohabitans endofungorum]|uniref:bifunctional tetrahydrofolate synthase/dihydrofolate synthase n=1 Tax=Mycetohabitans endofungorum TaxID=417203 RepID=UPI0030D09438
MTVFATLQDWLTHLETAHPVGIDMGLARIGRVKAALGLQFDCPVITVGGTNGKGSTCAILEAILLRAGYHVGCHTSPHLLEFNERARVDGRNATDDELLPHFEAIEAARLSLPEPVSLTYFEFTTLAIMRLFASRQLDAVILEVGLGGRLDAVNIIDADCAVITSVDLDHQHYLGDTREQIGREKAGIFRPGKPAIVGDPLPPSSVVEHAEAIGADLWLFNRDFHYEGHAGSERQQWSYRGRTLKRAALAYPALRGANQLLNTAAALAALEALRERLPVSAQDIRLGLANVELPGRFQVLPGKPAIVLDVAHNPHAAAVLAQNLGNMGYFPYTYAVFGAMADKDIAGVLARLKGEVDHWCVTELPTSRAASAVDIEQTLVALGVSRGDPDASSDASIRRFANPQLAYQDALSRAGENDRIVVFGSFYTVAGVMAYRKMQHH